MQHSRGSRHLQRPSSVQQVRPLTLLGTAPSRLWSGKEPGLTRLVPTSRLGSRVFPVTTASAGGVTDGHPYRGTLLIRNFASLGPYSKAVPRTLWWS
jgi:hypothetical protein